MLLSNGLGGETMQKTKYNHLLEPIKIGNLVLKNRFTVTLSNPHFVQGTES